jgi:hypothetical protein
VVLSPLVLSPLVLSPLVLSPLHAAPTAAKSSRLVYHLAHQRVRRRGCTCLCFGLLRETMLVGGER